MITLLVILTIIGFVLFAPECIVTALLHPFKSVIYFLKDTYLFFKDKKYNEPKAGELVAITGYFGRGKTLTATRLALRFEKRYDGKRWYDRKQKIWRTNRVVILSNCKIMCKNFVYLNSLNQIVSLAYSAYENEQSIDRKSDYCTTIFTLLDEAGAKMNSRSFKSNITEDFLSTILTCRKFHLNFYYTTQRFNLTDKLLRDVTLYVLVARKTFRSVLLSKYDAWEMENANNPTLIKPIGFKFFFADDRLYRSYNTLATVDDLKHDCDKNDRLTAMEILALRTGNSDINNVSRPSHKLKKLKSK